MQGFDSLQTKGHGVKNSPCKFIGGKTMRVSKIQIGLKGQVNMGSDEWYQPSVTMEAELDEKDDVDKCIQLLRLQVQKQLQIDIIQFRSARKIVTAVPISQTKNIRMATSGKQKKDQGAAVENVSIEQTGDPLKRTNALVKRFKDAFRKK